MKMTKQELYENIDKHCNRNLLQTVTDRKLQLFWHRCCIFDQRKLKIPVSGMMNGNNKRGRPHKELGRQCLEWCRASLQELRRRADTTKQVADIFSDGGNSQC